MAGVLCPTAPGKLTKKPQWHLQMTNGNIASKLAEALSLNIHFSPRFFTASTLQIGYRHLSASHMWELHGHPVLYASKFHHCIRNSAEIIINVRFRLSLGARFGFAGESLSPQKATFKYAVPKLVVIKTFLTFHSTMKNAL